MKHKNLKATSILLFLCAIVFGQEKVRHFRNISVDKGLSQSTIYAIVQDPVGFIWMGTQDGLNRYDGKEFTVFRPSKGDTNTIQSYYIRCMMVDRKGRLWVGGNGGISLFNQITNRFTNYRLKAKPGEWFISSMLEDTATHVIWAASNDGRIFRFDAGRNNFILVDFPASRYSISSIYSLHQVGNKLLVGTGRGLFALQTDSKQLTQINIGLNAPQINCMLADGPWFWIGTSSGLVKLDSRNFHFINYRKKEDGTGLISDEVRSVGKDADGNIWIGTFMGLSVMDPATGRFQNYQHQSSGSSRSISQNSVRSIYRDRQEGMWVGTFYGGVDYFHKNAIRFNLLKRATDQMALNTDVVNVIKQDHKEGFWIGTNDKGLAYWQPARNKISYFTSADNRSNGISSNNIKSIAFADNGTVLLGTHNEGLNVLDLATRKVTVYRHTPGNGVGISGNMVYSLLKDHAGRIWVGTRSGLDLLITRKRNFRQ